jgi:hypothetical protein
VPDVLLSGDHAAISRWRRDQALGRTARNRPDLVAKLPVSALDARDRRVLSEAGFAVNGNDVAHLKAAACRGVIVRAAAVACLRCDKTTPARSQACA